MYRSATIKLTIWYLVLVMAISLIFSMVVYHFATNELATGLSRQTQRIYREFPVFDNDPFFVRNSDAAIGAHNILLNLAYFNIAVLVVAGLGSYWLARRTLLPIEESNERQKRFVADASHELRTPLTAMKMEAEVALLDDNVTKSQLRNALKSAVEEADKLDTLLNSLLRLSHLESGEIRQSFEPVAVPKLITTTIDSVQKAAAVKHITIDNAVSPGMVQGNFDSLVQLFVILLDNAIKYSPEKSTITITSRLDPHTILIVIKDEGIGIEQDALAHVFDRFYRADKSRTGHSGFGLGLSIAKHIANLHDGAITLTSTPGKGTKASIALPRHIEPGEPKT